MRTCTTVHVMSCLFSGATGQSVEEDADPVMDYEQAMKEISVNELADGNELTHLHLK